MSKNNKKFAGSKYVWVALLSLTFLASSKPAHAQWAVADSVDIIQTGLTQIVEAADEALDEAQDELEDYQWETDNMDHIISMMIDAMTEQMDALTLFLHGQMITDGQVRETQKRYTTDYTIAHSNIMPQGTPTSGGVIGQNSGANYCTTANENMGVRLTGDAVNDLTRALVNMISKLNQGSNSLTAASYYAEACKRGFLDPTLFAGGTTQCLNAPSVTYTMLYDGGTVTGDYYYGADQSYDTVLGPDWYTMPVAAASNTSTNQLVLPAAAPTGNGANAVPATTSKEEMDFIAAVYACRFASTPVVSDASMSANNTVKSDADTQLRINRVRQQMAAANAANAPCLREVARRTRVNQATANAAAAGSVLKEMYNAEISRCQALDDIGIMSLRNLNATPPITSPTADLAECVKNGRSMVEMDAEEVCHWGHGNWIKYTVGAGVTAETLAELNAENFDKCGRYAHDEQNYKSSVEAELGKLRQQNIDRMMAQQIRPSQVSQ